MRRGWQIAVALGALLGLATPAMAWRGLTAPWLPEVEKSGVAKAEQPRTGLEKRVRRELVKLPYYSVFDNLGYRVDGYRVTLFGQTIRPSLRRDAERVVKRIEGVESVVNNIEVLPVSFHDDRLRLATYRAIYSAPPLQRYAAPPVPSIHIIVKRGHVTLEGVVDNESDSNIAYLQARTVPFSFSVTNNLRVAD